jgi:DNA-binding XRE family transcriptional regulator
MKMPDRVLRKRERLYTVPQLAAVLDVSVDAIRAIERDPIPQRTLDYLRAIGYCPAFYPRRKSNRS